MDDSVTFSWDEILQYISDAIVMVDRQGVIVSANPAMAALTGYTREELIDKVKLCDICQGWESSPEFTVCGNCYASMASKASFELHLLRKDGGISTVTASATRLPQEMKGFLVLVFRDMSEQQKQEEEQFQKKMTSYIMQAQEEERKRVSRDLHDGVGQTMYSMIIGLNMMEQSQLTGNLLDNFRIVKEMAVQALEEVRHIAVELRPCALDDWGLVPALRSYIKQFERTYGIVTELTVMGQEGRYGTAIETALYRICQEAMVNAAKYANIDKLAVYFGEQDKNVYLTVTDRGRGFDLQNLTIQGTGLGLYGMRERAQLVGGAFFIDSKPGQGTAIRVCVPLLDKEESV